MREKEKIEKQEKKKKKIKVLRFNVIVSGKIYETGTVPPPEIFEKIPDEYFEIVEVEE